MQMVQSGTQPLAQAFTSTPDQHGLNFRQLIQRGLEATNADIYYTVDSILNDIAEDQKQLWVFDETIVVTNIILYPTGLKELNLFLVAGENMNFEHIMEVLLGYAKHCHCQSIAGAGRKGWIRHAQRVLGEVNMTYRYNRSV